MKRRVVITGMGAVTPIGNTIEEFWDGIRSGKSGIAPITHFDASEKQKLTAQNVKEHIVVIPDSGGKIRVESVNKQYGHPEYRGIFEIDLVDKALHIINELPLEEYLYSVVPSEMPTEYQKEALKAQAVCALSLIHI